MKNKYYVTATSYNVLFDEIETTLCCYNGKNEFRQPSFERCWTERVFDCELDALNFLKEMFPDRLLTVFSDTGKVVSTYGHESALTSMVIRQERDL